MEYRKVELTCDPLLHGYQIDTKGILYSKRGKAMQPSPNHHGYLIEAFNVNGKMIGRSIHQLVAKQFIPNPENKPTVNHIDGNPANNNVNNLEWATYKEQEVHKRKVLHHDAPTYCKAIKGTNVKTGEVITFKSAAEAARYVHTLRSTISLSAHKVRPTCKGYIWDYITPGVEE